MVLVSIFPHADAVWIPQLEVKRQLSSGRRTALYKKMRTDLFFDSNLTQYHDFYQVLSFHQIEPESIDPVEYKKFLSNAAQLRATYAARLAEEEARKAEEIRRKAAEARKKFLEERDGK